MSEIPGIDDPETDEPIIIQCVYCYKYGPLGEMLIMEDVGPCCKDFVACEKRADAKETDE
jgi:hypothetical protein